MSLIADALKRAQEQRAQGKGGKDSDDRARRMLTGSGPLRVETKDGSRVPPSVAIAGSVLAAALITFGGVVWLAPSAEGAGDPVEPPRTAATDPGPRRAPSTDPVRRPAVAEPPAEGPTDAELAQLRAYTGGAAGTEPASQRPQAPDGADGTPGTRVADAREGGAEFARGGEETSFTLRIAGQAAAAPAPMDASELFGRALSAQQRGDLRGAAALYRRAIERNPSDAQLHNNLGTVYRALSMPGEALSAFRMAVEVDPSYAPAWSNLGIMLDGLGRDEEAVEAFREALRRDPSNTGARVNLANKYIGMGLLDDARSLLREVLSDAPALPEAHYAMARAMEAAGDFDGAIRHYRVFLDLADGRFPGLESRVAGHLVELEGGG